MTAQPDQSPRFSARSLIHGQGHPSQLRRLNQPWRLETSGQIFGVRRAVPSDLPGVMGTLVRSSARTRWQWRGSRGGAVPSISEMATWLRQPHSLVVVGASRDASARRPYRIVAIAGLSEIGCSGASAGYSLGAEILVADRWQALGIGRALVGHLAAASWLLGRRELTSASEVEADSAQRLLGRLGPLSARRHPHGDHPALHLSVDALSGLGPLRSARLG